MMLLRKSVLLTSMCLLITASTSSGSLVSDRAAVERVYYGNRLSTTKSFEEVFTNTVLHDLVNRDLLKEKILDEKYGIRITDDQVDQEARRIESATRAPEVLVKIKLALGNDPIRFGETVVRPILAERILRKQFQNDSILHANNRTVMDKIRNDLLASNDENYSSLLSIMEQSGQQVNHSCFVLNAETEEQGDKSEFHFNDLHPDLRNVLNIQLQNTGDVSAVIELADNFQIYLLEKRTLEEMRVAILTLPKINYNEWLANQRN